MGKKRILNLTSRKKRNGMLTWTNTSSEGGTSVTPGVGNLIVNGRDGLEMIWCPTAMDLSGTNGAATIAQQALRTASTCFMRGVSENIRIQSSSGQPWFHRRICFTSRGTNAFNLNSASDAPTNVFRAYVETSAGVERLAFNMTVNNMPVSRQEMKSLLFKGVEGKDWNNLIIAPVDTTRVNLKYDRTWTYRSGNSLGVVKETKVFHAMNKNLVYDDDENGDVETEKFYSTSSKAGMGDYYIMDFIQPGLGATASDLISLNFNSTLYWHEK